MNLTEQETRLIEALRKAEVKDPVKLVRELLYEFGGVSTEKITWGNKERVGKHECFNCQSLHDDNQFPESAHAPDCSGVLSERLAAILKEGEE